MWCYKKSTATIFKISLPQAISVKSTSMRIRWLIGEPIFWKSWPCFFLTPLIFANGSPSTKFERSKHGQNCLAANFCQKGVCSLCLLPFMSHPNISPHVWQHFFMSLHGNWQKRELFWRNALYPKIYKENFFGAGIHGTLTHSGFRKNISFGWPSLRSNFFATQS